MPRRSAALPPWLSKVAARDAPKEPREDWPAAYRRVAEQLGLDYDDVRQTWLAWKKPGLSPMIDDIKMVTAIEWLAEPEDRLAERIVRSIKYANTFSRMPDLRPRFLHYHTWNSLHSTGGFPDSIMVDRQAKMGYAWELKRECALPQGDQITWLDALGGLGGRWTVFGVIRPSSEHLVRTALDF